MVDLNKEECKSLYYCVNRFVKGFETDASEKKFWNDIYDLDHLILIRDKLKNVIKSA
tara:strand:+ start:470 stop:640 length:171 start_codon:yes stop_codon:yes gene_type:complete